MKRGRSGGRAAERPYHHGDLRQKLLDVAEEIILERGVDGFTLREAARRAGVSPAAPAHHFRDAKGLLTEVAVLSFREFGRVLEAADKAGGDSAERRLHGQAVAYVRFALEHPARFQLMFRYDKQDLTNQELISVARRSYGTLERAIRAATGTPSQQKLSSDAYSLLAATWSVVHGFSHLALGGHLSTKPGTAVSRDAILSALLPLVLEHLPWMRDTGGIGAPGRGSGS
jgi:AcrR family transcriptional regulator